MKNYFLNLWMLFFATTSFGQTSTETEKIKIKDLIVKSFDEIWSDLNAESIEKYYTKDFLLLENGEVWTIDTVKNYLRDVKLMKSRPTRVNSIEVLETKVSKGTAWIAYWNQAIFSVENKVVRKALWLESATAIWTESGWKLDMLHSTVKKIE
jgi:hypothetical protein